MSGKPQIGKHFPPTLSPSPLAPPEPAPDVVPEEPPLGAATLPPAASAPPLDASDPPLAAETTPPAPTLVAPPLATGDPSPLAPAEPDEQALWSAARRIQGAAVAVKCVSRGVL
jgi:hypothetical protein